MPTCMHCGTLYPDFPGAALCCGSLDTADTMIDAAALILAHGRLSPAARIQLAQTHGEIAASTIDLMRIAVTAPALDVLAEFAITHAIAAAREARRAIPELRFE